MSDQTLSIPWGAGTKSFQLPEASIAWTISPKAIPPVPDERDEILRAMREPIGMPPIPDLLGDPAGKTVAIVVDDNTRVTPIHRILPVVVEELNRYGVQDSQITVIIALGSHRYMTPAEIEKRVGHACYTRLRVINHEYNNPEQLTYCGRTKFNSPVYVNRTFVESDFGMCIGNIIPHFVAGWSGGAKSIQPGICGVETTAAVHLNSSLDWPERFGNAENDIRLDIEEIAKKAGLKFILNTILNLNEEVVHVVAGEPRAAHRQGVLYAQEVYQQEVDVRPDVVIVGSYPANRDLWQAGKALAAGCMSVRRGGTVILAAPCFEGAYPEHPDVMELGTMDPEKIFRLSKSGQFSDVVGSTGYISAGVMRQMAKVILVSDGIDRKTTEYLGYTYAESIQEAVGIARSWEGEEAAFGLLTHGADLVPRVREPAAEIPETDRRPDREK